VAGQLVDGLFRVSPGEQVVLRGGPRYLPMMEAIAIEVLGAGGKAHILSTTMVSAATARSGSRSSTSGRRPRVSTAPSFSSRILRSTSRTTATSGASGTTTIPMNDISTSGRNARLGPTLQDAGSWPTQLFGLSAKEWCDAPANERSRGP
jgi:hypothetical protein